MSESAQFYLPDEPVSAGARAQNRKPISDVHMRHTADGGEIDFVEGQVVLSDGLETYCYLSLFGGNERDSGRANDPHTWWGNLTETDPARHYRSETQHLLRSLPAVPANMRRIEDAAARDLQPMITSQLARSVKTFVTIPALNTVLLTVSIEVASGETYRFEFREDWGASTA